MAIDDEDRLVISWAERRGLRYYYTCEARTMTPRLRVHLGHVTAEFDSGKLVRLTVQTEGRYLNEAFCELTQLFELCRRSDAYLEQETAVTWDGQHCLFGED